jgi:hypothetical protein
LLSLEGLQAGQIPRTTTLYRRFFEERENAKIVIARLDRFSRRVSLVANILEQGSIEWGDRFA